MGCKTKFQLLAEARVFYFLKNFQTRSGAHPVPYQWYQGSPRGEVVRHKLTTHLHLVPRFRMSGAVALLPYMPPRHGQGKIYIFTVKNSHVICCCYRETSLLFHTRINLGYAIDMSSDIGFLYVFPYSHMKSIIYDGLFKASGFQLSFSLQPVFRLIFHPIIVFYFNACTFQ